MPPKSQCQNRSVLFTRLSVRSIRFALRTSQCLQCVRGSGRISSQVRRDRYMLALEFRDLNQEILVLGLEAGAVHVPTTAARTGIPGA